MAEPLNTLDRNLADSIAMLEQILEVMPHDADALKALYSAYRKVGRQQQAFDYLVRLTDVYVAEKDDHLRSFIRAEIGQYEPLFPSDVSFQSTRLGAASPSGIAPQVASSSNDSDRSLKKKKEADISDELALAWRLYEENQLSQEEYSSVLHDLTEVSSKDVDVPVSVLHVLNDRGFTQLTRVMGYLSSRSGVPCIALANFELQRGVEESLPLEIAVHRGALPFAFLGNDLLVAVLNPFNHVLVDRIESESGRRCHTYLAAPEDYDVALARFRARFNVANPPQQP